MVNIVITGDSIISAVCKKIKANWPGVKVYDEEALQGMETPCFFVFQLNQTGTPEMRDRSSRDYLCLVRYHPDGKVSKYKELREAGNALAEILREITLEDGLPIYSGKSNFEVNEDQQCLAFTTSYKVKTKCAFKANPMRSLEDEIHLKE